MSQPDTGHDFLRLVPSRGGVGRRDRALLVLSRVAGLSYPDIVELTTADVTISDGTARIRGRVATITLRSTDDVMLCGPCALARWLHVLDMTVIYPDACVAAAVLARSAPLAGDSPHACQTTTTAGVHARALVFLPPVDPWGILALTPARPHRPRRHGPAGPDLQWHDRQTPAEQLQHRTEQLLNPDATPGRAWH
jgi:hypothetical protein